MELDNIESAPSNAINPPVEASSLPQTVEKLDRKALVFLCIQHFSSAWGSRSFEFASYLFLITLFPDSLLLPSIFGFFITSTAILFAGMIGNLVDQTPRLRFVKGCIVLQKIAVSCVYACFLILFLRLQGNARNSPGVLILFAMITLLSSFLGLNTIAISVSIERDWVTAIAEGESDRLTLLNTYLRRIDLIAKLASPLFISLLTTAVSYPFTVAFLLGFSLLTMVFEFIWITFVFTRLTILAEEERPRLDALVILRQEKSAMGPPTLNMRLNSLQATLRQQGGDWKEFYNSPVFPSSLAIALLYLMVLSFDGPMLSYLKSHNYSDPFLAAMRGVGVVTGLIGTVVMPFLEKRVGIIRTGTYSITFELVWLVPVLISFFVDAPPDGTRGSSANSAILFTGMAISRIGLWSFDLAQVKVLQTTLQDHPRRNSITALQYSLCNIFDLLKYVLTIILMTPSQFKFAAVTSFVSVALATVSWLYYSRKERGHLFHLDRLLLRKQK